MPTDPQTFIYISSPRAFKYGVGRTSEKGGVADHFGSERNPTCTLQTFLS